MASLTPLSKGLIGLVVIGGMASAVWHLYLKERMSADQTAPSAVTAPMTPRVAPPRGRAPIPAPDRTGRSARPARAAARRHRPAPNRPPWQQRQQRQHPHRP